MTQIIWHWNRQNCKIFTKNKDIAKKAKEEGYIVNSKKIKPNIIKF